MFNIMAVGDKFWVIEVDELGDWLRVVGSAYCIEDARLICK